MLPSRKLLKRDLLGEIWRIRGDAGDRILRDTGSAAAWARPAARWLMRREAAALNALPDIDGLPVLLRFGRHTLQRSFLDGTPLHEAKPRDPAYFRSAMRLLRRLHRNGITHNDLAKEPNLLVTTDGSPAFIDFQLATVIPGRGRLFRLLAREDIRHLLKHKRTYCPDALTSRERSILASPSVPSRMYMATLKPVYLFVTRRLLGWADREGAYDRGANR